MNLTNNTILITGGSSGIGLEMARMLAQDNSVIICGRNADKLKKAKKEIPQLTTYQCDISSPQECARLTDLLQRKHPKLNVLINNAAVVHKGSFLNGEQVLQKLDKEVATNFVAPIRLIHLLLPQLLQNNDPSVLNITTGLIYAPRKAYPFYNATKAALHSFTQVLRMETEDKNLNVVEVLFPAVDTPWHNGNPPKIAISPEQAVSEMMNGLKSGKAEIRVGGVKKLRLLSRLFPRLALKMINSLGEK